MFKQVRRHFSKKTRKKNTNRLQKRAGIGMRSKHIIVQTFWIMQSARRARVRVMRTTSMRHDDRHPSSSRFALFLLLVECFHSSKSSTHASNSHPQHHASSAVTCLGVTSGLSLIEEQRGLIRVLISSWGSVYKLNLCWKYKRLLHFRNFSHNFSRISAWRPDGLHIFA